jgi:hypothetical protein
MRQLEWKKNLLLQIASLRDKISSYKFIHVFVNDKFPRSIVEFINTHFPASEHCFVFCGGSPEKSFPLPKGNNIFNCPYPECLAVSDSVAKVIFHGLYHNGVIAYISEHHEIMAKSYWIPWGGDLHDIPSTPVGDYVRSNFQGVAGNAYTQKIYQQKHGKGKVFFPFSISFQSIEYEKIATTHVPQKEYVQIQVNNSTHPSTLEVFKYIERFRDEDIVVTTILSYGEQEWQRKILDEGKRIFGEKFCPILKYISKEAYLKFLARNDIYILNQDRPQGMTTAFTLMALGKKIFMRGDISEYLYDEGYTLYDTRSLPELSFEEFCANPVKEENKRLAAKRFDPAFQKQCWRTIFAYEPPKPAGA